MYSSDTVQLALIDYFKEIFVSVGVLNIKIEMIISYKNILYTYREVSKMCFIDKIMKSTVFMILFILFMQNISNILLKGAILPSKIMVESNQKGLLY